MTVDQRLARLAQALADTGPDGHLRRRALWVAIDRLLDQRLDMAPAKVSAANRASSARMAAAGHSRGDK